VWVVVNIKRTSIKQRLDGDVVLINIKENLFRTDIKDANGSNYVKRSRPQQVFVLKDWFESLYNDHLKLYKCRDHSGALFVNRDGKAMSVKVIGSILIKLRNTSLGFLGKAVMLMINF
jgi:hypothetical protein